MSKLLYTYIAQISVFATLLTFIVALIKNKTLTKEMRVLFLCVFVAVFVEVLSLVLTKLNIRHLFLINLFTLAECTILCLFYQKVFTKKKYTLIIYTFLFCFYGLYVYDCFFLHGLENMDILPAITECFILIGLSLLYFYELARRMEYVNILANPLFWVNSSVLIYFSGSLFIFIFSNYILKHPDSRLWSLHNVLNIIYNILLIVAFWKTSKK